MKVTIALPTYFSHPIGGYHVHYQYANLLSRRGHRVTIVFPYSLGEPADLRTRYAAFKWSIRTRLDNRPLIKAFRLDRSVKVRLLPDLAAKSLPDADALIATSWLTAEKLKDAPRSKGERFYVLYDYEHWKTVKPKEQARIEATFKNDFRIVATSTAVQSMLATQGVVPETQIVCGIDFGEFGIDRDPSSREALTLGFPSRGESFKGTADAIAAARILHEKFGDALRITTFGSGKPAGLPDFIEWLQFPSQAELRRFYNDQVVFMLPSHFEGWGLTGVEAMACGAALVVTNNGGSADYAFDGKTALVVEPGNVDELAAAAERLLTDRALRLRLVGEGHAFVQRFTWESAADALEQLLVSRS